MKKSPLSTLVLAAAAGGLLADPIDDAKPKSVPLGGTTSHDEWSNSALTSTTNPGYPGFGSTMPWPSPVQSDLGGDASLNKISGTSNPASGSIYSGGFLTTPNTLGGQLRLTDTTVGFDLNTLVLQIEIGEAFGYDFFNHALPTLSYTTSSGTVSGVAPTFSSKIVQAQNGTFDAPSGEEPVYVNLWGLQWDLGGVAGTITSFNVSYTVVQHSQVYGLRFDGSSATYGSSMLPTVPVPEPSTYAAGLAALLAIVVVIRRRRRSPVR